MERPEGAQPGSVIGSMDAEVVNEVSAYLARLVRLRDLPQKLLIVHQFTDEMVTNRDLLASRPEVALTLNMDGFGTAAAEGGRVRPALPADAPGAGRARRALQRLQAVLPGGHGPDEPPRRARRCARRRTWSCTSSGAGCAVTRTRALASAQRVRRSLAARRAASTGVQQPPAPRGAKGSASVRRLERATASTRRRPRPEGGAPGTGRPSSCASRSSACQSSGVARRIVTAS